MPLEQSTVDVGELGEVLVKNHSALILRSLEHFEQLRQPWAETGAVFAGPRLNEIEEKSRGSNNPVSSANLQNSTRTRKRS